MPQSSLILYLAKEYSPACPQSIHSALYEGLTICSHIEICIERKVLIENAHTIRRRRQVVKTRAVHHKDREGSAFDQLARHLLKWSKAQALHNAHQSACNSRIRGSFLECNLLRIVYVEIMKLSPVLRHTRGFATICPSRRSDE